MATLTLKSITAHRSPRPSARVFAQPHGPTDPEPTAICRTSSGPLYPEWVAQRVLHTDTQGGLFRHMLRRSSAEEGSRIEADAIPLRVLGGSPFESRRWTGGIDPRICQTFAASPAEPGELPFWFSRAEIPQCNEHLT